MTRNSPVEKVLDWVVRKGNDCLVVPEVPVKHRTNPAEFDRIVVGC